MGTSALDWQEALQASVAVERRLSLLLKLKEWHDQVKQNTPLIEYVELPIRCLLRDFIENMQNVFQREILGTEHQPSHWKL